MKKHFMNVKKIGFFAMATLFASCSVDDAYDLSKDVDMTVAVGKGTAIPLGSTEPIMLTEMIDPEESDVIKVDSKGFYSICQDGEIDATSVRVDEAEIRVDPVSDAHMYDFPVEPIDRDALDALPEAVREEIINDLSYTHVVKEIIDQNDVKYEIEQNDIPKEMTYLRKMTFAEPVTMTMDIDIYTVNSSADFDIFKKLHLYTDGAEGNEHFYIEMPPYIVFTDDTPMGANNRLWLEGVAEYNEEKGHKHFYNTFKIKELDFSRTEEKGIVVKNGCISRTDILKIQGAVISEPLTFTGEDVLQSIPDVWIEPTLHFEPFKIASVEGHFNPEIDPMTSDIEIDLGDDMEFIYDGTFDFKNPQIFVNINSESVTLPVVGDISLKGYDVHGNAIANSAVNMQFDIEPNKANNFYITKTGSTLANYTSIAVPNLSNLIKKVPDVVKFTLESSIDNTNYNVVKLGHDMEVTGTYELVLPMDFNELELTYTETVEDVLGDDSDDITDYISEVKSVTVKANVVNTVPAEFNPEVVVYDKYGRVLETVKVVVEGSIAAGNGVDANGVCLPAVESAFEIKLSALEGSLDNMGDMDIKFNGVGSGVFNENEYLQLKDMSVTIDESIIVDMN